ncbi:uncharacterized protein LOC127247411 [Andrographis paniculata]|uniref:uncharacterized protein LOC127247411 n=1 Tax=Andrographis paniculata TaxID=175694 RepID=UPI0021E91CCF|nr:uncharacterized protein LOC127247411 [Andrographis paniculata]
MGFRYTMDLHLHLHLHSHLLLKLFLLGWIKFAIVIATDTLSFNQSIRGTQVLISSGRNFKFGFFNPSNTTRYYVGVMYNVPVQTAVWVANRDRPLNNSDGTVELSEDGKLLVLDGQNQIIWSSNSTGPVGNYSATLLETGNLVLQDFSRSGTTVWESFEHASDSFLARMRMTTDLRTNQKNTLTSWASPDNPSLGSYTASIEPHRIPQVVVRNGVDPYWRSGPWNGQIFIGIHRMEVYFYQNGFDLVSNDPDVAYLTVTWSNSSFLSYFILDSSGIIQQKWWSDETRAWQVIWLSIESECDVYGKCGPFGFCDRSATPICSCLPGFAPKNVKEWNAGNWTSGCARRAELQCAKNNSDGKKDGFLRLKGVKLPDNISWILSLEELCGDACLSNCSCIAYAYNDGIGCMQWIGSLIDVQKFSGGRTDLYIRLAHSELGNKSDRRAVIAVAAVSGFIVAVVCAWLLLKKYKARRKRRHQPLSILRDVDPAHSGESVLKDNVDGVRLEEFPFFEFQILLNATSNFDPICKLGQGGFGPVYKGKLLTGQEIAVKRLARSSNQGLEEFKNEVELISKLQHRNLVSLLGCCIEHEEKMLVYEYMPNGSLDAYLFDSHKQEILDWNRRMLIIEGISRGLLYLHRDSRLRIIHRDLKASNILLDDKLNPKISDFGMARIFGGNDDQANTNRVVGTLGYMAPEYALEGRFSEKSDVFSFGILLLEIVSGRRNTSFYDNKEAQSLVAYAWKLWIEEKMLDLIDPSVFDSDMVPDIVRCAHVGLLCVQETAHDRPSISTVVSMLSSEISELPNPMKPAFIVYRRRSCSGAESSERSTAGMLSVNDMTVTIVEGRYFHPQRLKVLDRAHKVFALESELRRKNFMGFRCKIDFIISILQVLLFVWIKFAFAVDTLSFNQSIHGSQFLISDGQTFKFGFFNPSNTSRYYAGVMYNLPVQTVVWVANRDRPLNDSAGTVEVSENGKLVVFDGQKQIVWSSNFTGPVGNYSATLLKTGNLVLRDLSRGTTVWESFQHATDSLLPGMKLTTDFRMNEKNILTSWTSPSDPSIGSYTAFVDPLEIPQVVIRRGSDIHWRSGPWNGHFFIGVPRISRFVYQNEFDLVHDDPASAYLIIASTVENILLFSFDSSGILQRKTWSDEEGDWEVHWSSIETECDPYGKCGPFGICNPQSSPICSCLPGYVPRRINEWNAANWTSGCTRRTLLQCEKNSSASEAGKKDGFVRVKAVKVPDNVTSVPLTEAFCGSECFDNCSCIAYAYNDGVGCMFWFESLIDVQQFSTGGVDLYIRLAHSELGKKKDSTAVVAAVTVLGFIVVASVCVFLLLKKYKGSRERDAEFSPASVLKDNVEGVQFEDYPFFDFQILLNATRNFDPIYKLGEGGFGPVYRGKLSNGKEIAVKRLAQSSNQGLEEFKNEVELISKLQHRNLVSLLGCCIEREEKMLVYEYMPNGSLDAYLFDSHKQELLDWNQRMVIIEGISRGLLYLHRDSRLKIIHRDLKASNILLDDKLNPKISDFGMARIFGGNENQANTNRVVGTLGYMAPEYALQGRFSEKSDVFSFGILLLEIVSGRRSTSFFDNKEAQSLVEYAWKLWIEEKILDLIDPSIYDSDMVTEIVRCAHVGLLCVQESAHDRPSISTVVSMLSSEISELPNPMKPAFIVNRWSSSGAESSERSTAGMLSVNDISVTIVEGR